MSIECTYENECSEGCSGFSGSLKDAHTCAVCHHDVKYHPNASTNGTASVGLGLAGSAPPRLPDRTYSTETRTRLSVYRQSISQNHGNGLDSGISVGSLGIESKEHKDGDDDDIDHRRRNTELMLTAKPSDVLPAGNCSFGGDHECHPHATTTGKVCCVLLPIFGLFYCLATRKQICHKCEAEITPSK